MGAQRLLEDQVSRLTDRLIAFSQNGSLSVPRITKSANHPDPEKYNGDRAKLEAFRAQINLKLKRNADHFVRDDQDRAEQIKLYYFSPRR